MAPLFLLGVMNFSWIEICLDKKDQFYIFTHFGGHLGFSMVEIKRLPWSDSGGFLCVHYLDAYKPI